VNALALGVEIGGTKLQAALGTPEAEIRACRRGTAPGGGAKAILEWFVREVPRLLDEAPAHGGAVQIGRAHV